MVRELDRGQHLKTFQAGDLTTAGFVQTPERLVGLRGRHTGRR